MDDVRKFEEFSLSAKFGVYVIFLLIWFVGGGLVSWVPFLSHGIERLAGEFALRGSVVLWLGLPVTGAMVVFWKNTYTAIVISVHGMCWLFLAGWVWYCLFQQ